MGWKQKGWMAPTAQSKRKSVLNIHWKDWCWSWNSNTLATWCEELTHLKRPWCWERLKPGGEGDDRGWDGWMASATWWTRVWASSGSWRTAPCPSLACCSLWSHEELDTTERLNWTYLLKMAPKNLPLLPFPISCWEKKWSERQRRKIYPTECRVPNSRKR